MANLAIYGSHNTAFAIEKDGNIFVIELERFLNQKNIGLAQYKTVKAENIVYFAKKIIRYLMEYLDIDEFETCVYSNMDVIIEQHYQLTDYIPAKQFITARHHESHAAGAFYQSNYESALIFSFDGGGDDGKFRIFLADREKGIAPIRDVLNPSYNHPHIHYDLGFPYMVFGEYLSDINYASLSEGNLVYPGKLMGLASYGNVNEEWLKHFINFYKYDVHGGNYEAAIALLATNISSHDQQIKFNTQDRLTGQLSYDIAATNQRAFEECFIEIARPYIEQYQDLPVCITGGCGLNIILNTRISKEFDRDVFVGPNPNDCGMAAGMLLNLIKPKEAVDLTYAGLPILDKPMIFSYIEALDHRYRSFDADLNNISNQLVKGNIVGVVRGRAEHGPRALGNRSILCDPSVPNMKDILNEKVKNREWYRPFAPVVRLEDVDKYFEWNRESRWMSFCPLVREEWREVLPSITHVDNTARVQTVTREQNEWLYDLLTEFEQASGIGVLLNTSFNVQGKPILSSAYDAFYILENTKMDCLVIEDHLIIKTQ